MQMKPNANGVTDRREAKKAHISGPRLGKREGGRERMGVERETKQEERGGGRRGREREDGGRGREGGREREQTERGGGGGR